METQVQHYVKFNSWNAFARRFVKAPEFTWEKVDKAVKYKIGIAGRTQRSAAWFETKATQFDFSPIWESLPHGRIDLLIIALDSAGNEVNETDIAKLNYAPKSFYKVPGWNRDKVEPLNWNDTVHKNIQFLLASARDEVKSYEKDLPRLVWASGESHTGKRSGNNYTGRCALIAFSLFNFHDKFKDSPLRNEAFSQAKQYVDWLYENHMPDDYLFGPFPYTTYKKGIVDVNDDRFGDTVEGRIITIDRTTPVALAMIKMWEITKSKKYLQRAHQMAEVYIQTQKPDGSWPTRVNPKTGESETELDALSNVGAITIAEFMTQLEKINPDKHFLKCRERAVEWILEHPVKNKLWQSSFEDVKSQEPYSNLSALETLKTIRYLIHYQKDIKQAVQIAEQLNDFVEDQFVIWNLEESTITTQCPVPTVLEQYVCYAPMEVHTGNWLLSLAALHYTTGNREYLQKGIAAANAICLGEHRGGTLSTWGLDMRFNHPLAGHNNWPCCNAFADHALMIWDDYYQSVTMNKPHLFDIIGFAL